MSEQLLAYKDLRRRLNCSQSTAETLVRTGQIRSVQVGAPNSRKPRRMFREVDVEAFIAARVVTDSRSEDTDTSVG